MSAILLPAGAVAPGTTVDLPDDELHHLRVRRASVGDRVRVIDGAGIVGLGRLASRNGGWTIEVESARRVGRAAPLVLLAGAGDRDRFGLLVEKATELGATEVVAVETERSRSVAGRVRGEHLDRLRKRALEALKQCGGAWVPEVRGPLAFEDALGFGGDCTRWLASASDERLPGEVPRGPLAVLVGPEGGFTVKERDAALGAGWAPVRLARATLRFDTAGIVALALAAAARAGDRTEEGQ